MATASTQLINNFPAVRRKQRQAVYTSIGRAGAYIRGVAQKSIKRSDDYSAPGSIPHTRKGQLPRSIQFDVNREQKNVVVGPTASYMDQIGNTLEFGGRERTKLTALPNNNWRIREGGHGPIIGTITPDTAFGKIRFSGRIAKLRTPAQVERARRIIESVQPDWGVLKASANGQIRIASWKHWSVYPERPFMHRALEIAKARLPDVWAASVIG